MTYYQENRERILKLHKKYREKNREKIRTNSREDYRKNRKSLLKRKKIFYQKNKKLYFLRLKTKWQEVRQLIGMSCVICGRRRGRKKRICCHEIHGKSHSYNPFYILKHSKDFVPLCYFCHMTLHQANNNPKLFLKYLSMLKEKE